MSQIKTCLWCVNPCDYYHKVVVVKCNDMLGEEASQFRQATAWGCENYKIAAS